jgi:DNA repair protein RadA/Sms
MAAPPVVLADIEAVADDRLATGIVELDRVLGGGLVRGSVVLLAGEPGAGKSTLSLQAAAGLEAKGLRVLLVCGEESVDQVAARARRIGGIRTTQASSGTRVDEVLAHAEGFDVVVIDSVQTMHDPDLTGEPGSVTQVRGCASALARHARDARVALLLVGHVTKDGAVAGPRVLEHLVDAVLTFEGDRGQSLRTLRSAKNRFGGTAELGVFEMKASGLVEVADASRLFLADRHIGVPGSAVGCLLEGRRAVALEIQSLVAPNDGPHPRRVAHGLERERLEVLAAVLRQRAGLDLSKCDVFVRVAGGFRADEPAVDLALALALASSVTGKPVPPDLVAIGEVGLSGDVRAVPGIGTRLRECARLGFRQAVVGRSVGDHDGLNVHAVGELREAMRLLTRA